MSYAEMYTERFVKLTGKPVVVTQSKSWFFVTDGEKQYKFRGELEVSWFCSSTEAAGGQLYDGLKRLIAVQKRNQERASSDPDRDAKLMAQMERFIKRLEAQL